MTEIFEHYDNPSKWVQQLREQFGDGVCGCHEGDCAGYVRASANQADATYSIGHTLDNGATIYQRYYYTDGVEFERLKTFIEGLL